MSETMRITELKLEIESRTRYLRHAIDELAASKTNPSIRPMFDEMSGELRGLENVLRRIDGDRIALKI